MSVLVGGGDLYLRKDGRWEFIGNVPAVIMNDPVLVICDRSPSQVAGSPEAVPQTPGPVTAVSGE